VLSDTHTQKGNGHDTLSSHYLTEMTDTLKPGGTNSLAKLLTTSINADITEPINKAATTTFKQLKTQTVHRGNRN